MSRENSVDPQIISCRFNGEVDEGEKGRRMLFLESVKEFERITEPSSFKAVAKKGSLWISIPTNVAIGHHLLSIFFKNFMDAVPKNFHTLLNFEKN